MKSWSRQIFLIILSVCFFSILYITLMEKNTVSVQQMKQTMDQMIEVVKKQEESSQKLQNYIETTPTKEMHLILQKSEIPKESLGERKKKIDQLFIKKLEHQVAENVIQNITSSMIDPALQALRLELLKELYGTTYDKLLEAALQAKPISSRPRPRSMQIIIATTWRSGSTFLEELIESHPGIYNFYEPLLPFGITNFYSDEDPDAKRAQSIISNLLKCKYDEEYIMEARKTSLELFTRNMKLWNACKNKSSYNSLCFQKRFLEAACRIFPWTLMKLVRIGVRLLKPVLGDETLNVHVVYLVRDPRAVAYSRLTSVKWCNNPLCADPSILCNHMEEDYNAVMELSQLFPGRIHVVRFEDLALSPLNVTKDLLNDLNLDFDPNMEKFIQSHTTKNYDKPWSTSRESSKRVSHWVSKIKKDMLNIIQGVCSSIMPNLGYKNISSTKDVSISDIIAPLNIITNL